jgi:type IV secretion system protein VirD4
MPRPVSPTLPDDGLLVGWSLEGEPRKPLIGFTAHIDEGAGSQYLEPILHTGEGHLITVAPTGAGKGVGCIIPALLRYRGPVVVIDPKGENYAVTARARREMGQRVIALDPFNVAMGDPSERGRFNPLDFLSPDNPTLVEDTEMISNTLMAAAGEQHRDPFWPYMGGQLLTLLLLYQLKRLPEADWTLSRTRELLARGPDAWPAFGAELLADEDPTIRQLAGIALNPAQETFGGYWAFSQMQTACFKGDMVAEAIGSSSFSLQDLVDGSPLSLYIIIPPEKLDAYGNLLKVWLSVMIAALTHRRSKPERPTLFILDEAAQLGEMPQLRRAITLLRGYGVRVWSFWQDLSQIQGIYPTTWQTLFNNCHVQQMFAQSTRLGSEQTYQVSGLGSPEYLQALAPSEMVLSVLGDQPVIARAPNYLTDAPFAGLFDENPFYRNAGDPGAEFGKSSRVFRRSKVGTGDKPGLAFAPRLNKQLLRAAQFHPVGRKSWRPVEKELADQLLADIKRDYAGLEDNADITFRRWPLSFYEEFDYFEVSAEANDRREVGYFLRRPGKVIYLDGTASAIHSLNHHLGLALTQAQSRDYLYFFCSSVEGEDGRFLIVDELDDLTFAIQPDPDYLTAVANAIEPPSVATVTTPNGQRIYTITACVLYADALFRSTFKVDGDGNVEMVGDEELFSSMPVIKDAELREFRIHLQPRDPTGSNQQ